MSDETDESERFLSLVAGLQVKDPRLTSLQAALIVAAEEGIARDSRTFARIFGVAHALVLRELIDLVELGCPLTITKRDERTLRTFYAFEPDASQEAE